MGAEEDHGAEQRADPAPAPAVPDLPHPVDPLALEPVEEPGADPEDAGLLGRRAAENDLAHVLGPPQ